jgi:PAS domain S-box-containing protein
MSHHITRALRIAILVMVGSLVLQITKHILDPHISIWGSDILTILFITVSTFVLSIVMLRREEETRSVLVKEIEHRRIAEEAVRRSETELRSFVENSPFGIFQTNIADDRFLSVNPALVKMLGYDSAAEVLSTRLSTDVYLNPQEREKTLMPLLRDGVTGTEAQWRRKDGRKITAHLSGRLIHESITGCSRVFEGIVEDVTERERVEQSLQNSEAHFRSLFENMSEGYAYCKMSFDDRGRPEDFVYLNVNSAFGELTGLRDVIGRKVTEVIPGIRESQPELFEAYARVIMTGKSENFEFELKSLAMWLAISVYSPQKEHFVAVFDVITERKRAEQELRESEIRFRQAVEGAPVGMYIQTDGIFRYFNPAALGIFGTENASHLIGQSFLEIIHPDSRAAVTERARLARNIREDRRREKPVVLQTCCLDSV